MALLGGATGCPGPNPPSDCASQPQGCNPSSNEDAGQNPGTTDAGTTDGGQNPGTTDAGTDAGTSLVVTQVIDHYNRKGIESVPRDFTTSPAELIVFDGGTSVSIKGTVVEPGQMRFDVPPGTYLVKYGSTTYVLTSSRTVDLGYRRFGRPDRGGNTIPAMEPLPASLDISGLEPVPPAPYETHLAFNSMDVEETGTFEPSSPLTEGQTSILDSRATYTSEWGDTPRYDPAQGDSAWVLQVTSRDAGLPTDGGQPWKYETVVRAAHLEPFSFDGGTMAVKATLQQAPQQDVLFEWRRDEFDALRAASLSGSPSPSASGSFYIYPALKDPRDGWVDFCVSALLSFRPPSRDPQTALVRRFSYGNPYPAPWEPTGEFTTIYAFSMLNHDGSKSVRSSETFVVKGPLSDLTSAPIRPRISLPWNFQVDGTAATTSRLLGTTTPMVTWEPPALGVASAYTVQISRLSEFNTLPTVARIHTGPEARGVRVPPGILTSGNTYAIRLIAHQGPSGVAPERVPLMFVTPYANASTVSGLLTVP